eukprot:g7656.t1
MYQAAGGFCREDSQNIACPESPPPSSPSAGFQHDWPVTSTFLSLVKRSPLTSPSSDVETSPLPRGPLATSPNAKLSHNREPPVKRKRAQAPSPNNRLDSSETSPRYISFVPSTPVSAGASWAQDAPVSRFKKANSQEACLRVSLSPVNADPVKNLSQELAQQQESGQASSPARVPVRLKPAAGPRIMRGNAAPAPTAKQPVKLKRPKPPIPAPAVDAPPLPQQTDRPFQAYKHLQKVTNKRLAAAGGPQSKDAKKRRKKSQAFRDHQGNFCYRDIQLKVWKGPEAIEKQKLERCAAKALEAAQAAWQQAESSAQAAQQQAESSGKLHTTSKTRTKSTATATKRTLAKALETAQQQAESSERRSSSSSAFYSTSGQGISFTCAEEGNVSKPTEKVLGEVAAAVRQEGKYMLEDWGIPSPICDMYRHSGVVKLFQWQLDCLSQSGVTHGGGNLIYSAPTSGGKTLVAEVLLIRQLIADPKRMVIFVVPYVSLAIEKTRDLQRKLAPLGFVVQGFHGQSDTTLSLQENLHVAVCTFEKANSICNRLLQQKRLNHLSCLVIDELHMMGDVERGHLIELILTKVKYVCEREGVCIQVVGMSATLANSDDMAHWLDATLFITEYRPVDLKQFIKVDDTVYNLDKTVNRTLPIGKPGQDICILCDEVVLEGGSVLVFCSGKRWCENTCKTLAHWYEEQDELEPKDRKRAKLKTKRKEVMDRLRRIPGGGCPVLTKTLPWGIAYHHAGLSTEVRELLESSFREGALSIMVATSTLATGVNLPARRVILRSMNVGNQLLTSSKYQQMAGRAGRTGLDAYGESILCIKKGELPKALSLAKSPPERLDSTLSTTGLEQGLLEVLASEAAQTSADVQQFVKCTFLAAQGKPAAVSERVDKALHYLTQKEFMLPATMKGEERLNCQQLGMAAFTAGLRPQEAEQRASDLERAWQTVYLATSLHLCFLVTPVNEGLSEHEYTTLQTKFYNFYLRFCEKEQALAKYYGLTEDLASQARCTTRKSKHGTLLARFWQAMLLQMLVDEVSIEGILRKFTDETWGSLQKKQSDAAMCAAVLAVFAQGLGYVPLALIIAQFQNRLSFRAKVELLPLLRIPSLRVERARQLYKNALREPRDVMNAGVARLTEVFARSSEHGYTHSDALSRKVQTILKEATAIVKADEEAERAAAEDKQQSDCEGAAAVEEDGAAMSDDDDEL